MSDQHTSDNESGFGGDSPLAKGYMWATVIMTMALELALPILLGIYVDYKLGTKCFFLILGVFLGFFAMIVNFIKLVKSKELQRTVDTRKNVKQDKIGK